jgi:hypothetical protein
MSKLPMVNTETPSFNNAVKVTKTVNDKDYYDVDGLYATNLHTNSVHKFYELQLEQIFHPINSRGSETNCSKIYHYLEAKQKIKSLVETDKDYKDITPLSVPVLNPSDTIVTNWGTGKQLNIFFKNLGIHAIQTHSHLCQILYEQSDSIRSEFVSSYNSEGTAIRVNRAKLLNALKNENCNIICLFINIYKKIPKWSGGVNHKNVLIIDKHNKKLIRFEPKSSNISKLTRFEMNEDRIREQLGSLSIQDELLKFNKSIGTKKLEPEGSKAQLKKELEDELNEALEIDEILKTYKYIEARGSQPTKFLDKISSYFCVIYSVYAVILFVINYEQLCKNIGNPLPPVGPVGPLAAKAAKASSSTSAGPAEPVSTFISGRPSRSNMDAQQKRQKRQNSKNSGKGKGKGKGNGKGKAKSSKFDNFGGGRRKSRKSRKHNFSKTLKKNKLWWNRI